MSDEEKVTVPEDVTQALSAVSADPNDDAPIENEASPVDASGAEEGPAADVSSAEEAPVADVPVAGEDAPVDAPFVQETPPAAPPAKKKWPLFLVIAGIAAVLIAVLVVCFLQKDSSNTRPASISARMTEDGTAYIPLFNGTCLTINEDVQTATLTKDRKHVVVLCEDGTLYVTDEKLNKLATIAHDATYFLAKNDGVLYQDAKDCFHRVLFADFSSVKLGESVDWLPAINTVSVLYATGDGDIYALPATDATPTKVGTSHNEISLEAVSDNGKLCVWSEQRYDDITIYLHDGDSRTKLGEVTSEYNYTYVDFSDDQKMAIVTNSYSDYLWIYSADTDIVKVKLAAPLQDYSIYTANGYFNYEKAKDVKALYLSTEGETGSNLYHITLSGDRERILSKVADFRISNGILFYINLDGDLFYGKLDGAQIVQEEKIASDVTFFELTANGKYVYYTRDYEDETATLYCYQPGKGDPVKVATEVACYYASYSDERWGWTYNVYSTDGATVYFYKDLEAIKDTYTEHGTLFKWTYGEKTPQKIASEVLTYSMIGGFESMEVNKNGFMYQKFCSVDNEETIYTDWYYYNGKEATKVANDVID